MTAAGTFSDGAPGAPAGAAEFPDLFAFYPSRPSWQVAGVDYAVGAPSGTTLQDPATIAMAGVTVNTSTGVIDISGSNVTLNGYDFSLNGGYGIYIEPGASGTVIENSNFVVGSRLNVPIYAQAGAGSLTVEYSSFNSTNNSDAVWADISSGNSGTFVAQYDSFQNANADDIDLGNGTVTPVVQYNLAYDTGTNTASHPDFVQFDAGIVNNALIQFNTIFQPVGPESDGMEAIQVAAQGGGTVTNTVVRNNVAIAQGPALEMSDSIAIQQAAGAILSGVTVSNNYVDATGAFGPFYPASGSNVTFSNNVNLATGTIYPTTIYLGATYLSDLSSVAATPSSGTVGAGETVIFALTTDEAMTVSGTPLLTLNDGGAAAYVSGSGSTTLTFSYTVAATDNAVAALAITGLSLPDGASISDTAGNEANLAGVAQTYAGLAVAASATTGTTPTLPVTLVRSVAAAPGSGIEGVGASITLTVDFSNAVTVTGTPTLSLNDGGVATYSGGSGSSALTFSYTVGASDSSEAALAVTGAALPGAATITDASGMAANLAGVSAPLSGLQIDTATPAVTQVLASPTSVTEYPGSTITLTLDFNEAVTVTGTPTLSLNDGGVASYAGGSGTSAMTFSYTVGVTDGTVGALAITGVNLPGGATIADAGGNAADLAGAVTTFSGLSIGSIGSVGAVIDTVFTQVSAAPFSGVVGVGNTIAFTLYLSAAVTVAGSPTLALSDGGVAMYAGGSGSIALTFTYTVGTTDSSVTSLGITGVGLPGGATMTDAAGNAVNIVGVVTTFHGLGVDAAPAVVAVAPPPVVAVAPPPPAPVVTMSLLHDTGAPAADGTTADDTLTGTGNANAVVSFTVDGVPVAATVTADASGDWTFAPAGLGSGTHTVVATETVAEGISGSGSLTFDYEPATLPTGVALAVDTAGLGVAESRTIFVVPGAALGSFQQVGGTAGDSYTTSIGGLNAAFFDYASGTLTAGGNGLPGGNGGWFYALTVQVNDTTAGTSSAPLPFDVVVGNDDSIVDLATKTMDHGASLATPTFVVGLGGSDTLDATGMTGPVLFAGAGGGDVFTGGSGSNTYYFAAGSGSTPADCDIINNFNAATDKIDLTGLGSTALAFKPAALAGGTVAADSIAWQQSGGNTLVYVNNTGGAVAAGAASVMIQLTGTVAPTDSNFVHA